MSSWLDDRTLRFLKSRTLDEKATLMMRLTREPGWALLKLSFQPEIRIKITDVDDREAFLYEAIRSQVIQEIFGQPEKLMRQAAKRPTASSHTHVGEIQMPLLTDTQAVYLWDEARDMPSP